MLADDVARNGDPLAYPLDELLIASILGEGIGVELHGCGIVVDGRGYLFVGQSGAGKTTTARLWLEHDAPRILSDDRIIVRKSNEGFRIYGTPWHGEAEICDATDAPLDAIFLLRQSNVSEIRPIEPADAIAKLFACAFPPFHRRESISGTLGFLATISEQRVVHELAFRPDSSAVQLVRNRNWS